MKPLAAAVVGLALSAVPMAAQAAHGVEGLDNPFNSAEDVAAGGDIFRSHCAVCHGVGGQGGRATDLTRGRFRHGSSDSELYETIANGIDGTEMPGTFFNGRQLWQIVGYVRSLSQGRAAEQATGDAAAGREIFFGKGGCSNCHRVNGEGGGAGPDLSDAGASRSLAHLEESITDPNAKVLPVDYSIRAKTKSGETVRGRRMNEDTFSAQLLTSDGRLRTVLKDNLAEYELVKTSTMPSYEGRLSKAELDDVVAYLAGLARR